MFRFAFAAAAAALFACAPAQALEIITKPAGYSIAVMSVNDPDSLDDFDLTPAGLELNTPFTANMTLLNGGSLYPNYLRISSFRFSVTQAGNYSSTFGGTLRSYDLDADTTYDLAQLAGEPLLFAYQFWSGVTPYLYKTDEFLGPDASPYRINVEGITLAFTDISAVPEPATWAMMLLGFGAIGATMRRRQTPTATAPM